MSEKRKPKIIFMLQWEAKEGVKRSKIELFEEYLFTNIHPSHYGKRSTKFRMRVNGKWWPEGEKKFYYKTEIRDLLWRSIPFY